jgi:hydrogenase-4 component B
MVFIASALALLALSGFGALILKNFPRLSGRIAVWGTGIACGLGSIPAVLSLTSGTTFSLAWAWAVPFGAFHIAVDPLSAFFLLPLFILSILAAVYGLEYLEHGHVGQSAGTSWFFFNLLTASMILVVVSRNAVLFLLAWEAMTLASFFLVTFEDDQKAVRRAGMIYLIATHVGTACLLVLFVLLGSDSGTLDFDRFAAGGILLPSVVFILAVIGFGTKAGFIPLHVWLPEAHPAAPSHVSALMSGVMIKLGIYGLVRVMTFLGTPLIWWGWLLVAIGITSGIIGVVFALAQHDLKRLLAYHSVENIGIIALGMGLGLLGMSLGLPFLAVLGWAGALLHVLNHALFKGLLFLGAGAVLNATGTRDLDHLGGLLKRMPSTGICFLIGPFAGCRL